MGHSGHLVRPSAQDYYIVFAPFTPLRRSALLPFTIRDYRESQSSTVAVPSPFPEGGEGGERERIPGGRQMRRQLLGMNFQVVVQRVYIK